MKFWLSRACFLVVFLALTKCLLADTWYVRADGAPHYSANIVNLAWRGLDPHHTCDGKHDAQFPAIGTTNVLGVVSDGQNQPCAVSDWRWLYDDQGSYGQLNWIIAGGDTVILDNTKSWRVGWDSGDTAHGTEPWCWGWSAGPYGCFNPTVPAGTAQQHTRILGRNYLSCSNADGTPNHAQMSQLFGGHAVGAALNLTGAQFVDVGCVEITQHAACINHGTPAIPSKCNSDFTQGVPLDDYDGDGIFTDQNTHDLSLQNLWIHGHTDRGVIGPIGGLVSASSVDISINGMAGWDFDDGRSTPSVNGVFKMSHSLIEFSGCNQAANGSVATCYSQSTGGYGDGIGTPNGSGMDVYMDHSIIRYNTQDGPDFVHVDTGNHTLQFTDNQSYGNNGASLKFGGAFRTALVTDNVLVANCLRLSAPIAGAAAAFNANLQDYCRALNGFGFGVYNGNNVTFSHNTLIGYAPTLIDPACTDTTCVNAIVTFSNNIVRGYDNPATYNLGGRNGGPGLFCGYQCDNTTVPLGHFNRSNNLYFGTHADNQANRLTGYALVETATNEIGGLDPLFVNEPLGIGAGFKEAELDGYNFTLTAGSPAIGAGLVMASVSADFSGAAWLTPPSLGALEYNSPGATGTTVPPSAPAEPVGPVATTTTLSASAVTSYFGATTLTATVNAVSGNTVPSGTVTLYYGSFAIATATLDSSGDATWVFPAVIEKLGITASYSGSSGFIASASNILTTNLIATKK